MGGVAEVHYGFTIYNELFLIGHMCIILIYICSLIMAKGKLFDFKPVVLNFRRKKIVIFFLVEEFLNNCCECMMGCDQFQMLFFTGHVCL